MSIDSTCNYGKVIHIDENNIYVEVSQHTACASCQAKNICNQTENKDSVFTIKKTDQNVAVNDLVTLMINDKKGLQAVVIAYVIPIVVFLFVLFFLLRFNLSELLAALISFLVLAVYYSIMLKFRNKLNKHFEITILKTDQVE